MSNVTTYMIDLTYNAGGTELQDNPNFNPDEEISDTNSQTIVVPLTATFGTLEIKTGWNNQDIGEESGIDLYLLIRFTPSVNMDTLPGPVLSLSLMDSSEDQVESQDSKTEIFSIFLFCLETYGGEDSSFNYCQYRYRNSIEDNPQSIQENGFDYSLWLEPDAVDNVFYFYFPSENVFKKALNSKEVPQDDLFRDSWSLVEGTSL